uniref:Ankyrin repeat domain-containing protein 61 n=1 Tax=Lygus hesperus TaxID=30085 RepID=A0A0A9YQQ5_LYGHE
MTVDVCQAVTSQNATHDLTRACYVDIEKLARLSYHSYSLQNDNNKKKKLLLLLMLPDEEEEEETVLREKVRGKEFAQPHFQKETKSRRDVMDLSTHMKTFV